MTKQKQSKANDDIKTILFQLDKKKKREKRLIDKIEKQYEDGIGYKEILIRALEANNDEVLRELREIKLILLMGSNLTPQQKVEIEQKANELKTIASTDDDLDLDEINEFK